MKTIRLQKDRTIFAAIDFQTRLLPVMNDAEKTEQTAAKLVAGGRVLGVEILVTQQYTKGIGPTTEGVAEALGDFEHIEKVTFSAMKTQEFVDAVEESGADTVVVCGIETHICVQQTVLDLLAAGYNVFVAADCVSSREKEAKDIALRTMEKSGAIITSHEAILFELLETSKAPEFKQISSIIK